MIGIPPTNGFMARKRAESGLEPQSPPPVDISLVSMSDCCTGTQFEKWRKSQRLAYLLHNTAADPIVGDYMSQIRRPLLSLKRPVIFRGWPLRARAGSHR